jgi:hypothetical protein
LQLSIVNPYFSKFIKDAGYGRKSIIPLIKEKPARIEHAK